MVDLVSSRTELRRAGPNRLTGPVPVSRRAHAVVRDQPRREGLPLLRLPGLGRRVHVRHGDRGRRLQGRARAARRPLQGRARARGRGPARRRDAQAPRTAAGAARAHRDVLRAPAVGVPRGAARARLPRRARPTRRATLREFRVGYAPSAWDTVLNGSRRAGFANREVYDAGLAQKSQKSGKIYDRFRSQIIFPLADPRGRVRGFAGRTLGDDTAPEVRQQPRERALPQGPASCSPPTSRARRRRRPATSWRRRATPTSSRCTRSGCATASGSWARR